MPFATRLNPYPVDDRYAGIYAHGVATGDPPTVYVSGQIGFGVDGTLPRDFRGQCENAIRNVERVLGEAGLGLGEIVKMSFFLTRRDDMGALVGVRKALLDGVSPAITTVMVAGLVEPEWLVEVEAVAVAGKKTVGAETARSTPSKMTDFGY